MMKKTKGKPKIITATDLQRLSGQIIRRVYLGEHFIVERDGIPMIAIISIGDYEKLSMSKLSALGSD